MPPQPIAHPNHHHPHANCYPEVVATAMAPPAWWRLFLPQTTPLPSRQKPHCPPLPPPIALNTGVRRATAPTRTQSKAALRHRRLGLPRAPATIVSCRRPPTTGAVGPVPIAPTRAAWRPHETGTTRVAKRRFEWSAIQVPVWMPPPNHRAPNIPQCDRAERSVRPGFCADQQFVPGRRMPLHTWRDSAVRQPTP